MNSKYWTLVNDKVGVTGLLLFSVLVCALVYGTSLNGELLFDSKVSLTHNLLIKIDGSSLEHWRTAMLSFTGSAFGRPLAMLTFAANHVTAGELSVVQLRATNLIIHLLCGCLVFAFLQQLLIGAPAFRWDATRARRVAVFAAVIWLLHPLHVSTVFYVIQRMAQLATLSVLAGLCVYCVYRNRWSMRGAKGGEMLAATGWLALITLAGILCKENAVLLLWLIPVVEVAAYRGRWAGSDLKWLNMLGWSVLMLPLLVACLLLATGSFYYLDSYSGRDFSLMERSLTQPRVLWHYLSWILLPDIRALALHHDDIATSVGLLQPLTTLVSLLAWVAALVAALHWRKRYPVLLLALLFYLVAHSMESSILPLEMVWEHRNYLPAVAVCLLVAVALDSLTRYVSQALALTLIAVILLGLTVSLGVRANRWGDELLLSKVNLENHPQSLRSTYHYANTLYRRAIVAEGGVDSEMLVASRHYYEKMHQLDNQDISALVSLYFLDQVYFPQLSAQVNWFEKLERSAATRTFSSADFNALTLLTQCLTDGACATDKTRVEALYQGILNRYPHKVSLWLLYASYQDSVLATPDAALSSLLQAAAADPLALSPFPPLIAAYDQRADSGGVFRSLIEYMARDTRRRKLLQVTYMLTPGDGPESQP